MELVFLIIFVYPFGMLFWDLYKERNYIAPGHISRKLTPGSDEWMIALLEPGDQSTITALEHEIDDTPDFDNSIIGRLSEGIYHNKDECDYCKPPVKYHKQAPRIPSISERKAALKTADYKAERKQADLVKALKGKNMILPTATYSSEPSAPVPTRSASLTQDQVHYKSGKTGQIKTLGMKPGEAANRYDKRVKEFLEATEPSDYLLTVGKLPEGVPEDAHASLRHLRADHSYLFIMYKWWWESWGGESRYHIRHVVINDNQNNRRAIGASTGPR